MLTLKAIALSLLLVTGNGNEHIEKCKSLREPVQFDLGPHASYRDIEIMGSRIRAQIAAEYKSLNCDKVLTDGLITKSFCGSYSPDVAEEYVYEAYCK